jgi:peptide/nickel transport system substrate-binding protein
VKVNLRRQTRNLYFAKILRKSDGKPGETSFYMLGWSPAGTYDVHNVFEALIQTPNAATKKGMFNAGGYSNPALDKLADAMEQETDKAKRDDMITQATKLYVDDFAYIPLHQQAVVWRRARTSTCSSRPTIAFPLRFVTVK